MTRQRFFCIAMAGSFIWYWVPGYLFTGLSIFNWVCWITPNNVAINTLFGTYTGLGMSALTFDWWIISSIGNPLITPVGCMSYFVPLLTLVHSQWWSQMNVGSALFLMHWVIAPILYCKTAD
jgi:hypothetical protein